MKIPDYSDVVRAHSRIAGVVHRTPLYSSESIDRITGGTLFFKCENFQKVGAFKFRGASNAVFSLSGEEAQKGVATHSSGNHAAALALAARMRNIPAYIVMPWTASEIKKKAVAGYGGIITYCEPTLAARESTLAKVVAETGATMIHPYDNLMVIAGQGTAAKEMIEDAGTFDIIMAPVGGGGLLSGTALSAKSLSPGARVIAAEPAGADDAFRSFYAGEIFPSVDPRTIADGLLTSLSERTFTIIMGKVDGIVTVSEEKIVEAMRMVWERMKIIIEPSSAVPLGAILEGKVDVAGVKTGIILSGGNVDLENLPF
ncbi:MAG: pyridoxal-phosphate dependent enzyme [Prolixibacteraceae bacterium]|jgi:threonine dehydratase|nr:pyridoxal-phosphate dependent enzyme [Prolixibacteraceae bacterium]NLS99182.1 pyridoxal-phosphate dependent enzyme [Bacteroidales bacterium]OQB82197.1 MAG: L-threonine dehydratase catabolic TdcB [Bacteroidetes bacterium ADurb.Bin123]HNU77185.1 pyridoxal-phosphate dependent enzyme [Prolixibacteraceae bacterium]HNZ69953.1 pyridoxal-phosphate dependent enzyme [Prolixibacteraceae bacterium]